MPTTRKTPTFREFLHESTGYRTINPTQYELDLVTAWNVWGGIEKKVGAEKINTSSKVKSANVVAAVLSYEPKVYQHPYAQKVAVEMAWHLRYNPQIYPTNLTDQASLPARRDTGSEGRSVSQIVTPTYTSSGVSSATSKADIVIGTAQCSMKNADDAQFGSAQHGEMTAIFAAVWPEKEREVFKEELKQTFAALFDKSVFYDLSKQYVQRADVKKEFLSQLDPPVSNVSKLSKSQQKQLDTEYQRKLARRIGLHSIQGFLTPKDSNKLDAFLQKHVPDVNISVLNKIEVKMKNPVFKKKFFREMLTGEGRFQEGAKDKIATHMLLWNDRADVEVYTVEQYVNAYYKEFQYSIRDRGSSRGASLRAQAKSHVIRMVNKIITMGEAVESSRTRHNAALVSELREHLQLIEHNMLTEGFGSWLRQKADDFANAMSISVATAKDILTSAWEAFKSYMIRFFETLLDLLDQSLEIFLNFFGIEMVGEYVVPPINLKNIPHNQRVVDLDT